MSDKKLVLRLVPAAPVFTGVGTCEGCYYRGNCNNHNPRPARCVTEAGAYLIFQEVKRDALADS